MFMGHKIASTAQQQSINLNANDIALIPSQLGFCWSAVMSLWFLVTGLSLSEPISTFVAMKESSCVEANKIVMIQQCLKKKTYEAKGG